MNSLWLDREGSSFSKKTPPDSSRGSNDGFPNFNPLVFQEIVLLLSGVPLFPPFFVVHPTFLSRMHLVKFLKLFRCENFSDLKDILQSLVFGLGL